MDALKILGGLLGNNAAGGNILGSILKGAAGGGQQPSRGGSGGLLGGILGGGGGGGGAQQSAGGGILGSILKAAVQKQMGGGARPQATSGGSGGIGGLLEGLLGGGAKPEPEEDIFQSHSKNEINDHATLLVRAMCNAAKADGEIDDQEQQNIIGRMGDLDEAEIKFLRSELASPLDVRGFVSSVPRGMEAQVYAVSVMTVKVDTRQEANYLMQLAQGMGLDQNDVAQIHKQMGLN